MQKTYNCLIVDDEQLARNLLSAYVQKIPYLHEVASCKSPLEAMEIMQKEQIDILLLDIQMPELSGLDFVKSLLVKPVVIFTTAYSEYAVQSYELDTVDYLLKPFSLDRFFKAINKGVERIEMKSSHQQGAAEAEPAHLFVKGDSKTHKILPNDILYIEGLKEYVSYFLEDHSRIISLNSLTKLEKELNQYGFMRVHRSYIVNVSKVTAFEKHMLWIGEHEIPVGKTYREMVNQKMTTQK
ncbi:LytTR family DNA-binding domain-containing protein [Flammeovirga sp. SubArs3]|uniref:LytR/AlgR family response regulator transcription factor n=1 Tax=Flammeovirga sp. SubArs3 TaxID=2995316 RepID=UPI00248AD577|nr:LytTR family DNA-binding domain-containing protein [Flammeovirga sp. SubArs3]